MKHISEVKAEVKTSVSTPSKNGLLKAMFKETSYGETENGAKTFIRSGSKLLDFYAQAGAMRGNPTGALKLFKKAFSEDRLNAMKILFYLRDVRGGQGERTLFRTCLQWLGETYPEIFEKVIGYVSEYGRWDDLFFDNEKCYDLIRTQISEDVKSDKPSLLAKWLPTINASSRTTVAKAKVMVSKLGFKNDKEYRKTVREIRKKIATVEEKMSAREWSKINYSAVPSQASKIYKDAFLKHDEKRYGTFIKKAEKGEVKINAGTLYPYQIYDSVNENYSRTLEALWNQLPDYTQGKNAIVVADVSGSMSGRPMSVSVSLALYFAERNKGQFKDHFITFTTDPRLQKITGSNLQDKMNSIERADWDGSTDIQKVFKLILDTATNESLPQSELPETIYIISDMEFDSCTSGNSYRTITNFEGIKEKYINAGYKMPNIVFWQVDSRNSNLPVQQDERGVAMVSGFSPVIFKMAVENKTPEEVMMDTISAERYSKITI